MEPPSQLATLRNQRFQVDRIVCQLLHRKTEKSMRADGG
jgi:hypothetical protein